MKTRQCISRPGLMSAVAAFGLVSFGLARGASAHPNHDDHPRAGQSDRHGTWVHVGHGYQWRYRYDDGRYSDASEYDLNHDGRLEHNEIDYRHFDRNRDGRLDQRERAAYWGHMVEMGYFGELSRNEALMLGQLAYLFDRDSDGRINGQERVDFDHMIAALRRFDQIDSNGDNLVSRGEAYRSHALRGRFFRLDRNRDGYVSRQEVREDVIRAIKGGDRFWYDTMREDRYGDSREHYGPRR
jgi:hypothetical protein